MDNILCIHFHNQLIRNSVMYKQIIPANDWFFVAKEAKLNNGQPVIYRIAAWALPEGGEAVIGLIGGIESGGSSLTNSSYNELARLVTVPPIVGVYKHFSELNQVEHAALSKVKNGSPDQW